MISIGKIFSFSAAHHLPHHEGLCQEHHGHNYKLEVEITGPIQSDGPATGMIMDFDDLNTTVQDCALDLYDHKDLNAIFVNPTAETMLEAFARDIQNCLPPLVKLTRIKLWETEKCYAIWTRED